jgi:hypothetical protein
MERNNPPGTESFSRITGLIPRLHESIACRQSRRSRTQDQCVNRFNFHVFDARCVTSNGRTLAARSAAFQLLHQPSKERRKYRTNRQPAVRGGSIHRLAGHEQSKRVRVLPTDRSSCQAILGLSHVVGLKSVLLKLIGLHDGLQKPGIKVLKQDCDVRHDTVAAN